MTNVVTHPYTPPTLASASTEAVDSVSEDAVYLTPDSLMAYCQSRLDSIDGQVTSSFDEQSKNASETKEINAMAGVLKDNSNGPVKDPATIAAMQTQFASLVTGIRAADPKSAALPQLIQTYNNFVYSTTGPTSATPYIDPTGYPPDTSVSPGSDGQLGGPELATYAQNLTDAGTSLNSESELQMVQLQSLMSQRQTAITLTTNLVQSLGDQENKIADNIGH